MKSSEFIQQTSKYLKPGTYTLTRYGKPYLKITIEPVAAQGVPIYGKSVPAMLKETEEEVKKLTGVDPKQLSGNDKRTAAEVRIAGKAGLPTCSNRGCMCRAAQEGLCRTHYEEKHRPKNPLL